MSKKLPKEGMILQNIITEGLVNIEEDHKRRNTYYIDEFISKYSVLYRDNIDITKVQDIANEFYSNIVLTEPITLLNEDDSIYTILPPIELHVNSYNEELSYNNPLNNTDTYQIDVDNNTNKIIVDIHNSQDVERLTLDYKHAKELYKKFYDTTTDTTDDIQDHTSTIYDDV